tara:strand:+ start:52 stop:1146 length:1095 start_codon:yes stop_codon:yes gene_type:complete
MDSKYHEKINPLLTAIPNIQLVDESCDLIRDSLPNLTTLGRMWRFDQLNCEYYLNDYSESHVPKDIKEFIDAGGVYNQAPELLDSIVEKFNEYRVEFCKVIDGDNFYSDLGLEELKKFLPLLSRHHHLFKTFKINRWALNFIRHPKEQLDSEISSYLSLASKVNDYLEGKFDPEEPFLFNTISSAGWNLLSCGLGKEAVFVWESLRDLILSHMDEKVEDPVLISPVRERGPNQDTARYLLSSYIGLGKAYGLVGETDKAIDVYKKACVLWHHPHLVDELLMTEYKKGVHYWSGAQRVLECVIEGYLISSGDQKEAFKNTFKNIFLDQMSNTNAKPENNTDAIRETLLIIYGATKAFYNQNEDYK